MPDDEKKTRAPTLLRLRAAETTVLFAFYASLHEIDRAKKEMEKRIRLIPNGWRDINLIQSVLTRLVDQIRKTIPPDKLSSLDRNGKRMTYRVHFTPPVTLPPDELIIKGDDLDTLVRYAHDYSCTACDKDCNKCTLGKALDHTMIQCRGRNESWSWIDCGQDYEEKNAIQMEVSK